MTWQEAEDDMDMQEEMNMTEGEQHARALDQMARILAWIAVALIGLTIWAQVNIARDQREELEESLGRMVWSEAPEHRSAGQKKDTAGIK